MINLRLLLLLTNLHLKLLSTQGTGADKLLSTQRVKGFLYCYQKMANFPAIYIYDNYNLQCLFAILLLRYFYLGTKFFIRQLLIRQISEIVLIIFVENAI